MDPLQIKIEEIGQNPIKKEEEQTQIKKEESFLADDYKQKSFVIDESDDEDNRRS
jgi:hypothetical protein